jgi:hypothetical protein
MVRPGKISVANCGITYWLTTRAGLPCLLCELLNGKLLYYFDAVVIAGGGQSGLTGAIATASGAKSSRMAAS